MGTIGKITGQAFTASSAVSGIAKASIASVSSQTAPSSGTNWISNIYIFDSQARDTGTTTEWTPSGTYASDGWVNGNTSVNGTNFRNPTLSKGWNCNLGATGSSQTGPNGSMTAYDNPAVDTAITKKYLYRETSSSRGLYDFVARTPGYNFSTLMNNTSNNLRLRFGYHAYGTAYSTNIYQVWADTATTTNSTLATLVSTLPIAGNLMASGNAPYIIVDIDLNAYRTINSTHYFWLNGTPTINTPTYRGDTAIDSVYFEEY